MGEFTTIRHSSRVPASSDAVWDRIISPEGINDELWPYMRMTVPKAMRNMTPENVRVGEPLCRSWFLLFGVVPFDFDEITVAAMEPGRRFLEQSRMMSLRRWEHERTLVPVEGGCEVHDRLSFEPRFVQGKIPGFRRMLAATLLFVFRHRHRRLARHFAAVGRAPAAPAAGPVAGESAARRGA